MSILYRLRPNNHYIIMKHLIAFWFVFFLDYMARFFFLSVRTAPDMSMLHNKLDRFGTSKMNIWIIEGSFGVLRKKRFQQVKILLKLDLISPSWPREHEWMAYLKLTSKSQQLFYKLAWFSSPKHNSKIWKDILSMKCARWLENVL